MRDPVSLLFAGNKAQMEKLMDKKNIAKGGWGEMTIWELFCRLKDELEELEVELVQLNPNFEYQRIRLEAADMANFAHMIIQRCDREIQDAKIPGA
jgi:hypothetical protein